MYSPEVLKAMDEEAARRETEDLEEAVILHQIKIDGIIAGRKVA